MPKEINRYLCIQNAEYILKIIGFTLKKKHFFNTKKEERQQFQIELFDLISNNKEIIHFNESKFVKDFIRKFCYSKVDIKSSY